jgi:hypothetical protein
MFGKVWDVQKAKQCILYSLKYNIQYVIEQWLKNCYDAKIAWEPQGKNKHFLSDISIVFVV